MFGLQRPKPSYRSEQITYRLKELGIFEKIKFFEIDLKDNFFIDKLVKEYKPEYFAHLGSQSSVKKSLKYKKLTNDSNLISTNNILNSIENHSRDTKFFFPSSATIYEGYINKVVNEETSPKPRTEYAISKFNSQIIINKKIEEFNLNLNTGIMFSHESEYRRPNFFTKKIVEFLVEYSKLSHNSIDVGNLSITRDIGYAKEYVEAIYKILINNNKKNYIVSSNLLYKLSEFVDACLNILDINFEIISNKNQISYINSKNGKEFIFSKEEEFRKFDLIGIKGDNSKIKNDLGWKPKLKLYEICEKMIKHEYEKI